MPLFLREFNPSAEEIRAACPGTLPEAAEEGLRLFNERQFWHAHEALETAWIKEPGVIRGLYKGILQAGVMYLQIERANLKGAMKMYMRSQVWLAPWPDHCRTVDVGALRADVEAARAEAQRLGKDGLAEFDPALLKPVRRVPPVEVL
ncbi:MAG: DUF309 domain-containing protein [Anaerolineae bacterium]|nr:MAG: DUF309 domain-containing protein [Anaerolineae bacterium]